MSVRMWFVVGWALFPVAVLWWMLQKEKETTDK